MWISIAIVSGAPSIAAVVSPPEIIPVKVVTQRFLTDKVSVVSIGSKHSCRAFRAIDIRASQYASPAGLPVAFADVERSPAAGLWVIGAAKPKSTSAQIPTYTIRENRIWRVVLKYPVKSLEMESDGVRRDLSDYLDAAGDSVTLSAEDRAELQLAWRNVRDVKLIGRSLDTGREVIDTLLPVPERDLIACDEFERRNSPEILAEIEDAPILVSGAELATWFWSPDASPFEAQRLGAIGRTTTFDPSRQRLGNNGPIRVHWGERLPGAPDKAHLTGCRMTDLGGEIERYRLSRIDGFVTQSGEAWITRDDAGDVRQVYIPGVFEALRKTESKEWTADVSVSAFANNPFEEPIYKGCLGSQAIPMVGGADTVSEAPVDELVMVNFKASPEFVPVSIGINPFKAVRGGSGSSGGLQFGGGVGSVTAGDYTKDPFEAVDISGESPDQPSPVPLPGAMWLYLTSFVSLGLIVRRRLTCV